MAAPTGATRILQVHPLRTCNLRCLHCYSESDPGQRERLSAEVVWEAITSAKAEGYSVVGFSGGEPLLYEPLGELLQATRDLGLRVSVTTNGMLLDERRVAWLREGACLVAISLDGMPESHNRMRGSPRAFETMQDKLHLLREARIAFGFIFTLTQFNCDELEWVAAFARDQGAQLLQVHALDVVGRAKDSLGNAAPDGRELAAAFVETMRLQAEAGDTMTVHFDLLDRDFLAENPGTFFSTPRSADAAFRPFAESISPLILEADGTLVPLGHGFPRAFALGNLRTSPFSELIQNWRDTRECEFRSVCRAVWQEARAPAEWPFINWYSEVRQRAANWKLPEEAAGKSGAHRVQQQDQESSGHESRQSHRPA